MITKYATPNQDFAEIPQNLLLPILKITRPEKIICFGIRSTTTIKWSPFLHPDQRSVLKHYDLLVLTADDDKRNRHELLNRIDDVNTPRFKINVLIHNVSHVNAALACGSKFFTSIFQKGIIAYTKKDAQPTPMTQQSTAVRLAGPETGLNDRSFTLARQFLKGAIYSSSCGWNNLAAFMLHQALEHTCIALIRTVTGYRPGGHNLHRLMSLTENFSSFYVALFPRNTKEENNLFQRLATAYSDARYSEAFNVDSTDIAILVRRATAFHDRARRLCRDKIYKPGTALCHTEKEFSYENNNT